MNKTQQIIDSKKTANGGWLKKDLEEWGVSWPPPKGWRKKLIEENSLDKKT